MLILSLILTQALAAAPSRANLAREMKAACLRSAAHADADQRRAICNCMVNELNANKQLTDEEFAFLVKTWTQPKGKVTPAPRDADLLQDYEEDVLDACAQKRRPAALKR